MPCDSLEFRHDLLIGVDDTDNADSMGTGRLCRLLAEELRGAGWNVVGITRHQHLRDPAIPYTSNNSSCALGVDGPGASADDIERFCSEFLARHYHEGADPGLCVARVADLSAHDASIAAFGIATQTRVMSMEEARMAATAWGCRLSEHGGTGLGIIGALGAVCLRATGSDGRFLELGDLRRLTGRMTVAELAGSLPIEGVYSGAGQRLTGDEPVETNDWVRPVLWNYRARIVVEPCAAGGWITRSTRHVD